MKAGHQRPSGEPQRWRGVKIARHAPGRFSIVTQLPSGVRVGIPLAPPRLRPPERG